MRFRLLVTVAALVLTGVGSVQASDVVSFADVAAGSPPRAEMFRDAKPMTLPTVKRSPRVGDKSRAVNRQSRGAVPKPVYRPGSEGGPVGEMVQLVPEPRADVMPSGKGQPRSSSSGITTMAYGESGIPFSTSRVELNPRSADVTRLYPYRAAGKLFFFQTPERPSSCSAALIDKGILLTAAHCVMDLGGPKFSVFSFIPGYHKGKGAYGTFRASRVYVTGSYAKGTDTCLDGVVCANDVAIIVLKPNRQSKYPGQLVGWYGFGLDGFGFTPQWETHVTQLGYPGSLDNGSQMIRNDSMGFVDYDQVGNTIIGSGMDGGSSGGPWVVNLGRPPRYTIEDGEASDPNIIVGVTSWGYDDGGYYLEQGASPLTSGNLGKLYAQACRSYPAACTK